ncbi:transcriptional regulator, LysR family [Rhizobiales bacterium GAS191]|nr:transcriptional regulator, LysR family [Rhizobiales bacterium GAS191]
MVTLKHLRYFEALSRLRHFGKAAEECAITQPALSMKVQELERDFGVALVERCRGDIRITDLGLEIARRARAVLTSVRDLTDFARHGNEVLTGQLVLGAIPSIAPYLLPAALPIIRRRFPLLELTLRETQTAILIEELLAGPLDVVLLSLPVEHPDIVTLPLFEDAFLLATHKEAELDHPVAAEAISGEKLLLLEEGHCLRDQALAYCGAVASKMRGQFGATSLATIVQLVANGYGVTLLPEMAVPFEIGRSKRIAVHRFAKPQPRRTIGLAWRRTSPRTADFGALASVLTDIVAVSDAAPEILPTKPTRANRPRRGA